MKKPIEMWHSLSPTVKVAFIAGVFSLLGSFIGTFLKPSPGRYIMVDYWKMNKYPSYDIFDTATGRVYFWRGVDGLKDIDDPINNKIINVINREHKEYLPSSK